MKLKYIVKDENKTINTILKNELHISLRLLNKIISKNLLTINNEIFDTRKTAKIGDEILINLDYEEDNSNIVPKQMDLDIVYEDEAFIVLNKKQGQATHPSIIHYDDSISNGLKYYFDKINLHKKIRPVNRLDLNTSGLIVFAKNEYVHECFQRQMNENLFTKEYKAIVLGILDKKEGIINKPISRKENSIIERCISDHGKTAITYYKVLDEVNNFSLVKCLLKTGRTHQIRVHFASIGHPLFSDSLYGEKSNLLDGQALICYKLEFLHPITNKKQVIELNNTYFDTFISKLKVGSLRLDVGI